MFKGYKVRLTNKNKPSSSAKTIRSPAFAAKYQAHCEQVIQIDGKNIQVRCVPQIHPNKSIYEEEDTMEFWALTNPQKYAHRTANKQVSGKKRSKFSLSEHLFKKYMKRRPSLTLGAPSYNFDQNQTLNLEETTQKQHNPPIVKNQIYNIGQVRAKPLNSGRTNISNTTMSSYLFVQQQKIQIPTQNTQRTLQNLSQYKIRTKNILFRKKKYPQC